MNKYDDDDLIRRLRESVGDEVEVVVYGNPPQNVALENVTHGYVIMDFDLNDTNNEPPFFPKLD